MKLRIVLGAAVLVVVAALLWWWLRPRPPQNELALYGNVDLRQVDLPFNNSERIAAVLVQEGDHLQRGQVLAKLDTSRIAPMVAQAEAQVAAQRAMVERLHNGTRPEEIDQARANVDAAKAESHNARVQYDRLKALMDKTTGRAISQQQLDDAKATLDSADAKLAVNQKALDLSLAGPRKEDIAQGEAQLQANLAQLKMLQQQLADCELFAPANAVVRNRLMEPGEMASPTKPVFTLAVTDPKRVRAYVSEPDLGKVRMGQAAAVSSDSFADRRFEGWVGFISSMAEFTPKSVQTEELRTQLVYEVRIFVNDPDDDLRLGMPATVHLSLDSFATTRPTEGGVR